MSLEVEDGTGKSNSESYVSAADCLAYATARGLTFANSTAGEQALRRATTWLDGTYRARFSGDRLNGRDQALEWPRTDAVDAEGFDVADDAVPSEIIRATCEAAVIELATPGDLSPTITPGKIIQSASVDGAVSVSYAENYGGVNCMRPAPTVIDDILASLLGNRQNSGTALFGTGVRA